MRRTWRPGRPTDVAGILGAHKRGHYDPTYQVASDGSVWRTSRPGGEAATVRILGRPNEGTIEAEAWGPGAAAAVDALPLWLGADDKPDFRPEHAIVARAVQLSPGLLIGRTGMVMEALVPAVIEQKVTGTEAYRGWVRLLREYGEPAPGPAPRGMLVAPGGRDWAKIPSWGWHQAGVTPQRARTIVRASRVADQLDASAAKSTEEADRRLRSIPGIGPWTSAEIRQRTHGDPDAISIGDANLPHAVAYALAGERRASDERMLELLLPYVGNRHRVATLITRHAPRPPRRAPRAPLRDYRRM